MSRDLYQRGSIVGISFHGVRNRVAIHRFLDSLHPPEFQKCESITLLKTQRVYEGRLIHLSVVFSDPVFRFRVVCEHVQELCLTPCEPILDDPIIGQESSSVHECPRCQKPLELSNRQLLKLHSSTRSTGFCRECQTYIPISAVMFRCQHCRAPQSVPTSAAGDTAKCSACDQQTSVPKSILRLPGDVMVEANSHFLIRCSSATSNLLRDALTSTKSLPVFLLQHDLDPSVWRIGRSSKAICHVRALALPILPTTNLKIG